MLGTGYWLVPAAFALVVRAAPELICLTNLRTFDTKFGRSRGLFEQVLRHRLRELA